MQLLTTEVSRSSVEVDAPSRNHNYCNLHNLLFAGGFLLFRYPLNTKAQRRKARKRAVTAVPLGRVKPAPGEGHAPWTSAASASRTSAGSEGAPVLRMTAARWFSTVR